MNKKLKTDTTENHLLYYCTMKNGLVTDLSVFNLHKNSVAEITFCYDTNTYRLNLYDKKNHWWTIEIDEENAPIYGKRVGDKYSVCGNEWLSIYLNLCKSLEGMQVRHKISAKGFW